MTDRYQGHLGDGSGVQAHSAGGLYPFVLFAKNPERGLMWGIIKPDGQETPACFSYSMACTIAEQFKQRWDARQEAARISSNHVIASMVSALLADRPHRVGDPVEPAQTDAEANNAWWTRRRDADFNLGPGLPPALQP